MSKKIPQEIIDEIRSKTNIVDVIGQYVQLKKSGKNYSGLCPFHDERTPSFSVAEDKQIYHCFGCGKGGTVFKFLQELEGISFPESVKKVADMSHISFNEEWLGTRSDFDFSASDETRKLIELHEKVADLYHHILLHTKAGAEALAYLKKRGLSDELIETFQIGFAPRERTLLQQVFENDKVESGIIESSGLMVQRESGEYIDRFYQRIMFPIKNAQGKMIAFSGRILDSADFDSSQQPKYLNSPETEIFNKRTTLFNFNLARSDIRKTNEVILFEGFMDVIAAWSANIKNGVASMGTSLTNEQMNQLKRVANEVLICYDGDSAGVEATNRAIHLFSSATDFDISVVPLPEKLDPDEYIKKYGAEAFRNIVNHGRETVFSFKMDYFKQNKNLQNEREQFTYIDELLHELIHVSSVIEREKYIQQLASEFQITTDALNEQFAVIRDNERIPVRREYDYAPPPEHMPENVIPFQKQVKKLDQIEKAEQLLLYRIFHEQTVRSTITQKVNFSFVHDEYQELYMLFEGYAAFHQTFVVADFLDYLQENRLKDKLIAIAYMNVDEESSEREISDCLKVIRQASIREKISHKKRAQQEACQLGNGELETQLAIEIINLTKELKK